MLHRPVALCLLLASPLAGQLSLVPDTVGIGQLPVGARRVVPLSLINTDLTPVLVEGIAPLHPSLSLPAPPVTGPARWLAGQDSLRFLLHVTPVEAGPLVASLRGWGLADSVSVDVLAEAVDVFVSEVLADPPSGLPGDANGDGERETYADEFVELRNAGPDTVDISGWRLGDDDTAISGWFEFPMTYLPPGARAVLFGGGTPTTIPPPAYADDGRIGDGLANGGDRVLLITASGDTADIVDGIGWGNDRSVVRESAGEAPQPHDAPADVTERFSPGRAALTTAGAGDEPRRVAATVLIVEILADPPPGDGGDANGDGVRDTYGDEFIELLNVADVDVDIGDWSLSDDDTGVDSRFRFPPGTVLASGSRVVLFGGGAVAADLPAHVDDGRIGNGLSNGGDEIILLDAAGDTVDAVHGSDWPADRASIRLPERCPSDCAWVPHDEAGPGAGPFSPGMAMSTADTTAAAPPSIDLVDIRITEVFPAPLRSAAGDANGDGHSDTYEDEFVEIQNAGPDAVVLSGWQLSDDDASVSRRFTFPPGTVLPAGAYAALFGGGAPAVDGDFIFVDDGRIGNGLTNSGDRILLLNARGDTVAEVSYGKVAARDQSLAFLEGVRPHAHGALPARTPYSPGAPRPVYEGFAVDTLRITLGRAPPEPALYGLFAHRREPLDASSIRWRALHDDVLRFDGSTPRPLRRGETLLEAWLHGQVVARAPAFVRYPSPVNSPPRFLDTPPTHTWVEGDFRYLARAVDDEGTTLSYAPVQLPDWLRLGRYDGLLTGRSPPQPGRFEVVIQVTDGQGGLATQAFSLTSQRRPRLRIAEVLADPPPGAAGDADGDGTRQTWADEFVELVNDGTDTVLLDGWELTDASGRRPYRFLVGTRLEPTDRFVVFGSDAGGRLGDGLGNRRDAVFVIDPAGPETLATARYDVVRDPDESLVWPSGRDSPSPHSQWPGRLPYSPGARRPLAVALRLVPPRLDLVAGRSATVRPVVRFSDGVFAAMPREIAGAGSWHVSSNDVEVERGRLRGITPGQARVTFLARDLEASAEVSVRPPLVERLSFRPAWTRTQVVAGSMLSFSVRLQGEDVLRYSWRASTRAVGPPGEQFHVRRSTATTDKVAVRVWRPGGAFGQDERVEREWILTSNHPPEVATLTATGLIAGREFVATIGATDLDDDVVALSLDLGPEGLRLGVRDGQLRWTPTSAQVGAHTVRVRASDGQASTTADFVLHVVEGAGRPAGSSGCTEALAVTPNPFRDAALLRLCPPPESAMRVDIFDVRGRLLRQLRWPPGRRDLSWDGDDRAGRTVASGVYFFEVRSSTQRLHARAVRLR